MLKKEVQTQTQAGHTIARNRIWKKIIFITQKQNSNNEPNSTENQESKKPKDSCNRI